MFGLTNTLVYIAISVLNAILLFFASGKFLLGMQQLGYKGYRYIRWVLSRKNTYLSRLYLLSLLGFLFFMILGITFAPVVGDKFYSYTGFVAYIFFISVYIGTEKNVNEKLPLKKTRRLIRLEVVYTILLALLSFALVLLINAIGLSFTGKTEEVYDILKYAFVALTPMFVPFILYLAYAMTKPFEDANNRRYVKKTKEVLKQSDIIKIGITGSYGKTSVKEILKTILSVKYRVLATPESYNTPLGIALSVKQLDSTYDVFIAEMGARQVGDIRDLARLVDPDIAVLTGVNEQHLESFGTAEDIKNTKFELFDNLKPGGKAFFNVEGEAAKELSERFKGEKYCISAENGPVTAKNVTVGRDGLTFDVCIEGEKPFRVSTTLLGKHSVSNILLAIAVAYNMGLTPKELFVGVTRLYSIKHRLQVLPNFGGVTLIDDSYNSNFDGAKSALEAIKDFDGRKVIITPGLVELGRNQYELNFKLGEEIAKVCDVLIVSAKTNAEALIEGFRSGGGDNKNIHYFKNVGLVKDHLKEFVEKGDVVLFENDLPDTYE